MAKPVPASPSGTYTKFATELWDGFDAICKRAKLEVQFLRDIHKYFQTRLKIEKEYSQALQALSGKSVSSSVDPGGSLGSAFESVLSHTALESSLHGSVAASFAEKILDPVGVMVKDMDQVRQRLVVEGQGAIKEYQKSVQTLSDAQSKYYSRGRELVAARLALQQNKKDQNREKLERDVSKAEQSSYDADSDYRRAVLETNAAQDFFFNTKLPKVHSEFEHSMFSRIHMIKLKLKAFVSLLEELPPQNVQALDTMSKFVDGLDNEGDIFSFVAMNKTGESPPLPFVYEEFDENSDKKKKGKFARMASGKTLGGKKNKSKPPPSATSGTSAISGPISGQLGTPMAAAAVNSRRPTSATSIPTVASSDEPTNAGGGVYQAFRPPVEEKGKVYGRSMADLMADQQDLPTAIPIFLQCVVEAIYAMDGPSLEGIFRIPPPMEELNAIKLKLDQEGARAVDIVALSEDAHTPCGLLKAFLRELPEPLIPTEYYEVCIQEPDRCIEVVNALPELSRTVIVYLANFLQDLGSDDIVAQTLMSLENLSMVFAPSLLRCPYTDPLQILNAAKREGTFALKLLQLMPTRQQLAEGMGANEEQPGDVQQHYPQEYEQQQAYDPNAHQQGYDQNPEQQAFEQRQYHAQGQTQQQPGSAPPAAGAALTVDQNYSSVVGVSAAAPLNDPTEQYTSIAQFVEQPEDNEGYQ